MGKRYISVLLAALIIASSVSVSASAAAVEYEVSQDEKGTFFFDSGDWNTERLCFYIWDATTDEYASNGGWTSSSSWSSFKKLGGTPVEDKEGVFESYEVDFSGRDDHAVYVIFHDKNTEAQTFDCLINSSVLGHTAKRNGVMYENPIDSEKKTEGVEWDGGTNVGAAKLITSTGKVQGEVLAPNTDPADVVANFVLNYLGTVDSITGASIVTNASVANAISEFGTNSDDVWAKYQTHSDAEGYNAEDAEAVIYGRAEEIEPEVKGTFFFDSGDWNPEKLCFYIWDATTGEYAANGGWSASSAWSSFKKLGGTPVDGKEGVFESYEVDFGGREDHAVYVIFHNKDTDAQTFDCLINASILGHTAKRNGVMYENPIDSEKKTEGVEWDGGTNVGAAKLITSTGKVQGEILAPNTDPADLVASFVLNYFGARDSITGASIVTNASVANAIKELDTTSDDVWTAYQNYSESENYNAEKGQAVIYGTLEETIGMMGDVDGNEEITSADALLILRRSVQLEDFDANTDLLADIDGNGTITSADSLEVLRASVKLPSAYAIGSYI